MSRLQSVWSVARWWRQLPWIPIALAWGRLASVAAGSLDDNRFGRKLARQLQVCTRAKPPPARLAAPMGRTILWPSRRMSQAKGYANLSNSFYLI
jgi:hypothetical protein